MGDSLNALIEQLNDFDLAARTCALTKISALLGKNFPPCSANVNMHLHSFFSYNAEDFSPARIALEAKKKGLYAAGLCDFDVLDGLEEFLYAGNVLALRTSVNIETRAYLGEFAKKEINSPGEPGVTYIMGAGFGEIPPEKDRRSEILLGYKRRAQDRNIALINRINSRMGDAAISYEVDVLPLTPSGNATERHIVKAYIHKAITVFENPMKVAAFWEKYLGKKKEEIIELMADIAGFEELVRSKLVKKGGIGYEQPSITTFPPVEEFINMVIACNAIPMITWLDGTSDGEANAREMLECLESKGCSALNIIPDRNWNISDPEKKKIKMSKLREIVYEAEKMDLPINIGTEMNKQGLPFFDDLSCDALCPYKDVFLNGAQIMVGQTLLSKYAGFAYCSEAAISEFPSRKERNKFFAEVGKLPPISVEKDMFLKNIGRDKALEWFYNECRKK